MKTFYLLLVLIHGLIHLLGFVKGFGIKDIKEFKLPISKSMGEAWLIASLLVIAYCLLHFFNFGYAWSIGICSALFSQFLVVKFWKDAKYGTIINLLVLIISIITYGNFIIKEEFRNEVNSDFSGNNNFSTEILTENDLMHLPAVVQKYLRYTGFVGKPRIKNFRAEFRGGMRGKPEEEYIDFHSVQYNFLESPSRFFYMNATKMGLPASGLHAYQNESASFQVKLLNWFTIVDAKGDKLNQAETVTLFNDMCFIAPGALIDKRISWETVNDTTVRAQFKNGNLAISALLFFRSTGELFNFISYDRYETDGKHYSNYPWKTPVKNYRMINGYLLPGSAQLIYEKEGGDFIYGELDYVSVNYNLNAIED